jgi:citrate lyase alpha subunit
VSPSRGPTDLELALVRCTTAKVALLEAAELFRKALDEEQRADEHAASLGITPPRLELDRVTYAAWQVHRGQAFWDRTPAEATPLRDAG